jgi:hypothetical protein
MRPCPWCGRLAWGGLVRARSIALGTTPRASRGKSRARARHTAASLRKELLAKLAAKPALVAQLECCPDGPRYAAEWDRRLVYVHLTKDLLGQGFTFREVAALLKMPASRLHGWHKGYCESGPLGVAPAYHRKGRKPSTRTRSEIQVEHHASPHKN